MSAPSRHQPQDLSISPSAISPSADRPRAPWRLSLFPPYEPRHCGLSAAQIDEYTEPFLFPEGQEGSCAIDYDDLRPGDECRRIKQVLPPPHTHTRALIISLDYPLGMKASVCMRGVARACVRACAFVCVRARAPGPTSPNESASMRQ